MPSTMFIQRETFKLVTAPSRVGAAQNEKPLFRIRNQLSGSMYLVDSGACISVIPRTFGDKSKPSSLMLQAANGSNIRTYGTRNINLCFGSNGRFSWNFVVADVTQGIIGSDFLQHYGLLVDVRNKRLISPFSPISFQGYSTSSTSNSLSVIGTRNEFLELLKEFPALTEPILKNRPIRHGVKHHIITKGPAVYARARRLSPEKLKAAKSEFRRMQDMGIIRPSSSPWASPLHMVPKDGEEWRPCGDYRKLNASTVADRYPVPLLQDFSAQLDGCKIFSKVDLVKAFLQVPVAEEDIPKTAVITPFGLYEYLFMPYGLSNAGQTFQRLIDSITRDLDFVFVYLDDILIASKSPEEHIRHLKSLFNRLVEHGLIVNVKKCVFGQESLEFLGHHITREGIFPLQSRVQAIQDCPTPSSPKALQEFLGMLNFYNRFLPHISEVLAPLYDLVKKGDKDFQWCPLAETAFQTAKDRLCNATLLHHPVPNAKIVLATDASGIAVGASLEQEVGVERQPLAFFSRKLRPAEKKYSTFDRELLAVYLAIKHFRYFLEGRPFTIVTDHKPLVNAFDSNSERSSPRQARHMSFIAEFSTDFRYRKGDLNVVPDALSRMSVNATQMSVIDFRELAELQQDDGEIRAMQTAITNLKLQDFSVTGTNYLLTCDISQGIPRPIVPAPFRQRVFDILHGLSHPGIRATQRMISERFVWHGMKRDIAQWVKCCLTCQQSKVHRHVTAPLEQYPLPERRFEHLNIDITGPFPVSNGYTALLTVVDRFTRWPEAIPLKGTSAEECARGLLHQWVSRFGVPATITSDRGRQFESEVFTELMNLLGIFRTRTTSYHPTSNGIVERFHRSLKAALRAKLNGPNWYDELPIVLLGLRASFKEDINASPAEMTFGTTLRLPGEFFTAPDDNELPPASFLPHLRQVMTDLRPSQTTWHRSHKCHVPSELESANEVFIREDGIHKTLKRPYHGPYHVLEKGPKFFKVDFGHRTDYVSVDRLKPAFRQENILPGL